MQLLATGISSIFVSNDRKMSATVPVSILLTTDQLADLIRTQLPKEERLKLASLLQAEETEPTNEQIISDFIADYRALKNGTLKTRPIREVLDEL